MKRYTTLGMATDGGKVGNITGLAMMAEAQGKEIPEVGTTTFRPPYTPISIGALKGRNVGEHFRVRRRTPMHAWNLEHGATMTMAGLWDRPWYFARDGEGITEAYIRETDTVRRTVGLCDVTSLGKIAIQGPDATEFLNRIYANAFAKVGFLHLCNAVGFSIQKWKITDTRTPFYEYKCIAKANCLTHFTGKLNNYGHVHHKRLPSPNF